MRDSWYILQYFIWRGIGYGLAFAALLGVTLYPLSDIPSFLQRGGIVGLIVGILLALGVYRYNIYAANKELAFEDYQATLTRGAGLLITIITAIPLYFLFAPLAGIVAAYLANDYTENHAPTAIKRKQNTEHLQQYNRKQAVMRVYFDKFYKRAKPLVKITLFGLSALSVGIALNNILRSAEVDFVRYLALVSGAVATFAMVWLGVVFLLVPNFLLIAFLIQMLNQSVFSPTLSLSAYRKRLMVVSAILPLLSLPLVSQFVHPFMAVIILIVVGRVAALTARDYTDWYFEGDAIDKAKPDASRLAEMDTDDEADMPNLEIVQKTAAIEKRKA